MPIIVGGTGLYVRAVTATLSLPGVPPHPALRERLTREAAEVSIHFTHSPFGAEWAGIFTACRREAARTRRAVRRLAHQVHA